MSIETARVLPIVMLIGSNIFMTFAWYGHLKHKGGGSPAFLRRPKKRDPGSSPG